MRQTEAPTGHRRTAQISVPAWLRLVRSFQRISNASADLQRARGLTMAQYDVIARVGAHDGASQQDVADALLVTKGNVCQLLDRMETRGLIRRERRGRENLLHLTDTGRALFEAAVPDQQDLIESLFSALSSDEQHELHRLLRKLDRSLAGSRT